jgi:hypothetical protein
MIGSTQLQEPLIAGHYGRSIPTGWTGRSSVIPSERLQPSRRPRARRHGLAERGALREHLSGGQQTEPRTGPSTSASPERQPKSALPTWSTTSNASSGSPHRLRPLNTCPQPGLPVPRLPVSNTAAGDQRSLYRSRRNRSSPSENAVLGGLQLRLDRIWSSPASANLP